MLLGFAISSCEDDDVEVTKEVVEDSLSEGSGEMISTTFTVGISAPNVSGDLDVATRADGDNANIEYANLENGGRFQNIVVVLVDHNDRIYGIHCHNWGDNVGVKEYTVIFSDIKVPAADVNTKSYKVYAFGNICEEHYTSIEGEAKNIKTDYEPAQVSSRKIITDNTLLNNYCLTSTIVVVNEADLYNINFKLNEKYSIDYYDKTLQKNVTDRFTSAGMPVNNSATATVVKGNTQFNVAMKRVCARLQVTFRNFTGTYKVYGGTEEDKPNNVYVDKFEIKNVLANKANYFCNNTTSVAGVTSSNFDILKALGGATATNDHKINKIENGKDTTISMYIFENNKGNYTYDLKVDRGKSLGLNTTVIDPDNAYVIWNNQKQRSIAYDGSKIYATPQENSDVIPFDKQVFWKLVTPNVSGKTPVEGAYAIKNYPIDKDDKYKVATDAYFTRLTERNGDLDWGFIHKGYEYKHVEKSASSTLSGAQYIQFVLNESSQNEYSLNLLQGDNVNNPYWNHSWGNDDYAMLSICQTSSKPSTSADKHTCDSKTPNGGHLSTIVDWSSTALNNYEWTLYAKYIIKNNQQFKDNDGAITQISRNHSYELDFSVMPNYDTKQEILVNCVRKQNEVNWSEVQK